MKSDPTSLLDHPREGDRSLVGEAQGEESRARCVLLSVAAFLTGCAADSDRVLDVTAAGSSQGLPVFVGVYGFGITLTLALFVVMAVYAFFSWRSARASDRSAREGGTLRKGPAVLRGYVASGGGPAVRVEISQGGREKRDDSGNWSHRWEEKGRRIEVRPFELVLLSGERVQVEPTGDVLLADALDGVIRVNRAARVLVAELVPDEALIAVGDLELRSRPDGYRGAVDGWTLVPPKRPGARMILSTEGLGTRFRRRARSALVAIFMSAVVACGVQALSVGYHLRVWAGTTVVARVVGNREWTTVDGDGDEVRHRSSTIRLPNGFLLTERVSHTLPHQDVYVRWVPAKSGASALGRTPSLHWGILGLNFGLPLLTVFLFRVLYPRRWWEGERQSSRGAGILPPASDEDAGDAGGHEGGEGSGEHGA